MSRFKAWWAHAFAVDGDSKGLADEDRVLVEKLADFVVRRRMSAPALMLLESSRPLNFVGSQVLAFLAPFATLVFAPAEYDRFVRLLERRKSIDWLVEAIAERESREHE
jgi:hypothetical protein